MVLPPALQVVRAEFPQREFRRDPPFSTEIDRASPKSELFLSLAHVVVALKES
jgi:hypothetical protein